MRKDQLNLLVSSYKESTVDREQKFSQIYEAVQPMITYVKKRFNRNFLALVDYESVASEALLKSIDKYRNGHGHFANYFMTWLRSMVTREGINNPAGIRIPEYLAKKDFQISEDAKKLMLAGKAREELMEIYNLTNSQYDNLLHYYTEVPRYLEGDTSSYLYNDSDIKLDINIMLDSMPESYRQATIMTFGLKKSKIYSESEVHKKTGITNERLLKYLQTDLIKLIMEEYNG